VVGPGRSGTSWVAATLGSTPGAAFLLEPDNPGRFAYALHAAVGLGSAPILAPGDDGPPALRRLWDAAFGAPVRYAPGQHRLATRLYDRAGQEERWRAQQVDDPRLSVRLRVSGALAVPRNLPVGTRHRVVKSIRSHYMLGWLTENWDPSVVVCLRHPLDVVASRLEMGYPIPPRTATRATSAEAGHRFGVEVPPSDDPVEFAAWSVGVQLSVYDEELAANPEYHLADHEALCRDPVGGFRTLAADVGLEWTVDDEARIVASNRPGSGYALHRVASDLPDAWRRRLSVDDARRAAGIVSRFPIAARYDLEVPSRQ